MSSASYTEFRSFADTSKLTGHSANGRVIDIFFLKKRHLMFFGFFAFFDEVSKTFRLTGRSTDQLVVVFSHSIEEIAQSLEIPLEKLTVANKFFEALDLETDDMTAMYYHSLRLSLFNKDKDESVVKDANFHCFGIQSRYHV